MRSLMKAGGVSGYRAPTGLIPVLDKPLSPPKCHPVDRKKVAIVSSFSRLGQWRGIMRYGQQAGWICQRHDRDSLERLATWNPDGVLFQVDEFDQPLLDYVRHCGVHRVGLRALLGHEDKTPLVLPDLAGIGRKVASHFVASNYKHLCYLGPQSDETANAGCTHFRGMQEVADANDIRLECIFPDQAATWRKLGLLHRRRLSTGWDRFWEMGPALIDHLLVDPEPVALFCAFVEPAMEFIEMVDERKVDIPGRIGMAAQTEDALNGSVTKIPLTCIVPDYEKQGFEAAKLLDRLLSNEEIAPNYRKFIPNYEFILRESSNQIVTSDPQVNQMLDHVRRNALDFRYTPEMLAQAFNCSLRLVQIRFRKSLQRGVAEIIREYRTHRAAELIRKTNMPLQQIVSECGFSGHHQLERAVKSAYGQNPSALRKSQGVDHHS